MNIPDSPDSMLIELKEIFLEKFKSSLNENFSRAFNLVKTVERNAELNASFEKENIVNVHIIEHLVDYIKKMSVSFTDLNDEFLPKGGNEDFIIKDKLMMELQEIFFQQITDCYFIKIFSKLDHVLHTLVTETSGELLNVQKFFFFYYILYKMNDVFLSFINSSVSFLVSPNIYKVLEARMEGALRSFQNCFLHRITHDIKVLMINKDDGIY